MLCGNNGIVVITHLCSNKLTISTIRIYANNMYNNNIKGKSKLDKNKSKANINYEQYKVDNLHT